MKHFAVSIGLQSSILAGAAIIASPIAAQSPGIYHFEMAEQPLDRALRQVARLTGVQIMFAPSQVSGLIAPAIRGDMRAADAVRRLIAGADLVVEQSASAIVIKAKARIIGADVEKDVTKTADIVVTGSRIRGEQTPATVIALSRQQIYQSGQTDAGEAVRSLPQSFNGGQNPGVGIGAGGSRENENLGSGSTINLRGLGQDATLTLINGHRVAYNVASQGVDVSGLPLEAIDRIEVVADGSSALYGSDAVGGVANIILRRDYDGLWTSARIGAATDGGDWQQQYGAVAGRRWSSGGILAAYDYERDTPVVARQRSYASSMYSGATLLRSLRHDNFVVVAHQEVSPALELQIDGGFNKRWSDYNIPITATGDYRTYGLFGDAASTAFFVAPSLRLSLPGGWETSLSGVVSRDRTHYGSDTYVGGQVVDSTRGCYCNSFSSVEASGEGPIFQLPGGSARLALGGGYRTNGLHAFRTVGGAQDIDVSQSTWFGYGELNLPVISPDQAISGFQKLIINSAVRYESYLGGDKIATPKVGVVYAPISALEIKATWGKSFKAPTLYERFSVQYASLYSASTIGGTMFPPSATALVLSGANPQLKSERATTFSLSAVAEPPRWPGFRAEVSYFDINYRDRVATPLLSETTALGNAAYSDLVELSPSASSVAEILNPANYLLYNYLEQAPSASTVVAIVDNRYRNISRQSVNGVDALLKYASKLSRTDNIDISANLTYLNSKIRLGATGDAVQQAGIIFNPPHFRTRGGVVWDHDAIGFAGFVNYIGPVEDNRNGSSTTIKAMTTIDLTARLDLRYAASALRGFNLLLSIQNAFNSKPGVIRTDAPYLTPFDSTNYSAIGRFISLALSKHW